MTFLTRLSLANRGLVALIAIVITGFGIYAIPSLKQQLLPSLEFPGAFIGASLPGASPEIMENRKEKSRAKRERRRQRRAGTGAPKHAAAEPDGPVPDDVVPPASGGGAHEAP